MFRLVAVLKSNWFVFKLFKEVDSFCFQYVWLNSVTQVIVVSRGVEFQWSGYYIYVWRLSCSIQVNSYLLITNCGNGWILTCRAGMILTYPVHMKAFLSGNFLKWIQLTFYLRLYFTLIISECTLPCYHDHLSVGVYLDRWVAIIFNYFFWMSVARRS